MNFLYPKSPFENKVEENYEAEYNLMKDYGFKVFLVDTDSLQDNIKLPKNYNNEPVIYRGWMLVKNDYEKLAQSFNLNVSVQDYLFAHHLPNWYQFLKNENKTDLTIESIIATEDNIYDVYHKSGWTKAFLKDYVKSVKTGRGSFIDDESDINRIIHDMKHYRGFIEEGLILRPQKELHSEVRFFVFNQSIFYPSLDVDPIEMDNKINLAHELKDIFAPKELLFYTLDIALNNEKKAILIEMGDAQVSDTVGWNIENFAQIFQNNKKKLKI